jgi:hypothetical protein
MSTGKTKVKKWSYFLNSLENEPFLDGSAATANMAEIVVLAIANGQSITAKKQRSNHTPDAQKSQIMIRRFYA